MADKRHLELGETVALKKPMLDGLIQALKDGGFQPVGPQVRDASVIYAPIESIEQLPAGYISVQAPGRFRLERTRHSHYFDFIPGAASWKQFLFPPRLDIVQ